MAKWQGINLQDVYQDWADEMQNLTLAAINHGIDVSKKNEHPPSQGEFIANCKTFRPDNQVLKLESKLTEEQKEINKARIAEMVKTLARSKQA